MTAKPKSNAGRAPIPDAQRSQQKMVYLRPAEIESLKELGEGNITVGVQTLLAEYEALGEKEKKYGVIAVAKTCTKAQYFLNKIEAMAMELKIQDIIIDKIESTLCRMKMSK